MFASKALTVTSTMDKEDFSSVNDDASMQGDLRAAVRDGDSGAVVGAEILEGIRRAVSATPSATASGDGTASKRPRLLATNPSSSIAGTFLAQNAPRLESATGCEDNPSGRRWMSSTGRKAPRVGSEFQVDILPDPSSVRTVVSPATQDDS